MKMKNFLWIINLTENGGDNGFMVDNINYKIIISLDKFEFWLIFYTILYVNNAKLLVFVFYMDILIKLHEVTSTTALQLN